MSVAPRSLRAWRVGCRECGKPKQRVLIEVIYNNIAFFFLLYNISYISNYISLII